MTRCTLLLYIEPAVGFAVAFGVGIAAADVPLAYRAFGGCDGSTAMHLVHNWRPKFVSGGRRPCRKFAHQPTAAGASLRTSTHQAAIRAVDVGKCTFWIRTDPLRVHTEEVVSTLGAAARVTVDVDVPQ